MSLGPVANLAQSDVHTRLNRDQVLSDTWWCLYIFCGGNGCSSLSDAMAEPVCASDSKQLCIRSTGSCTYDFMGTEDKYADGLCSGLSVCFCLTEHMQIPPLEGQMKCICFNKKLFGEGSVKHLERGKIFESLDKIFEGTFWIYYCFCMGLGVSGIGKDNRPLYAGEQKQICVRGSTKLENFNEGNIFCASLGKEFCLWSQCSLMPAPNSHLCLICNMGKKAGADGDSEGAIIIGKPGQVEMS